VTAPFELDAGVWLSGFVPRDAGFEDTGGPFFLDAERTEADLIPDDLSLGIRTCAGLVVCLGCCHAGIINTLRHLTRVTGETRVLAVIGGLHLLHAGSARLEQTVEALKAYAVPYLYPGHCSGEEAVAQLERSLGPSVQPCFAGQKIGF
jgi:7,8-dihydropterin-6-yl-methyl-4-(beta-D-ribofuranosyl)aminobenzene 5'-phosphate synthase